MKLSATGLKFMAWISWLVIVLGGLIILIRVQPPTGPAPNPIARVELPQNTLLRGDLSHSGFDDRYVIAEGGIKAGAPVKPEDVGSAPIPPSALPVRLLLVVPVKGTASSIDMPVGSRQELCGGSTDALTTTTVEYVHCTNHSTNCSATVAIPFDALGKLATSGLGESTTAAVLKLAQSCKQ